LHDDPLSREGKKLREEMGESTTTIGLRKKGRRKDRISKEVRSFSRIGKFFTLKPWGLTQTREYRDSVWTSHL